MSKQIFSRRGRSSHDQSPALTGNTSKIRATPLCVARPDPFRQLLDERERLPLPLALAQRYMTMLPRPGEVPRKTDPVHLVARDIVILLASAGAAAILGGVAVTSVTAGPLLIPAGYAALAATGRLRKLTVGHMHEAAHGVGFQMWDSTMSRQKRRALRFWLAETCSVIALTRSAGVYMKKHAKHHSLQWLGTVYEPDGDDLAAEGFARTMPAGSFWRRLAGKLFNPIWYAKANLARLRMGLGQGKRVRRIGAAMTWGTILGSAAVLPFGAWVMGIGLPWLLLYPAASLLQVLSEHPYGDHTGAQILAEYAARTWDRLPWDPVPKGVSGLAGAAAWIRWLFRFAVLHVPSRLAVLDTTMIWHRWHHLAWLLGRPFDAWWTIAYEARDAWLAGILPEGWEANTLNGLLAALMRQRDHLETPE